MPAKPISSTRAGGGGSCSSTRSVSCAARAGGILTREVSQLPRCRPRRPPPSRAARGAVDRAPIAGCRGAPGTRARAPAEFWARNLTTLIARALTIATSDSSGGAGIQADLKAFAAAGVHGTSALVALTAQNTVGVTAIHQLPPEFVVAQLDAVWDDIGVDAAKTGMLFSRVLIETVADWLETHPVPLVVDPVMVASSGAQLLEDDAVGALVERLFPLATVVTPNLMEAQSLVGEGTKPELAERLVELGAAAAIVTGGHGSASDHLFDGEE